MEFVSLAQHTHTPGSHLFRSLSARYTWSEVGGLRVPEQTLFPSLGQDYFTLVFQRAFYSLFSQSPADGLLGSFQLCFDGCFAAIDKPTAYVLKPVCWAELYHRAPTAHAAVYFSHCSFWRYKRPSFTLEFFFVKHCPFQPHSTLLILILL